MNERIVVWRGFLLHAFNKVERLIAVLFHVFGLLNHVNDIGMTDILSMRIAECAQWQWVCQGLSYQQRPSCALCSCDDDDLQRWLALVASFWNLIQSSHMSSVLQQMYVRATELCHVIVTHLLQKMWHKLYLCEGKQGRICIILLHLFMRSCVLCISGLPVYSTPFQTFLAGWLAAHIHLTSGFPGFDIVGNPFTNQSNISTLCWSFHEVRT